MTRSARAASRSASGCRPPASSPASWGSPAASCRSATASCRPRATSPASSGRARAWRRVGDLGDVGGIGAATARDTHARAHPTATADRLRLRGARPLRIPARGLGVGGARGLSHGRGGGPRLRRPARRPAAARGAGGLRGPGARGGHRPRPRAGVLGVRPGRDARAAHARPRRLPADRAGGPRQRRPGAERVVPGAHCGSAASCSTCPSTSTAWTSTRSPPPERRWSW